MTEEDYNGEEWLDGEEWEDDSDDPEDEDRAALVSAEVERWELEAGVELSDAEFQSLATQLDLYGIPPEQSYRTHTEAGKQEAGFENLVCRIEAVEQRSLTEGELDSLWRENFEAEKRGEGEVDTDGVLLDLDDSTDRAEYIGTRLAVPQEREQPSAVQVDDDGDEIPSFNYENRAEREAAIDAAMSGQPTSVHDSSYTTGDDD